MRNRERNTSKSINLWLVVLAAVTVLVSVVLLVSTMMKYRDRIEQIEQLKAQKDALENRVEQLKDQLDAVVDDDYIASVAHDKLGMYYPDEIVFGDGEAKETETASE